MKIVKRIDFVKLPPETLYASYEPCVFGELRIKGDTLPGGNDWFYQDIVGALDFDSSEEWAKALFRAAETGESLPVDFDCGGRDGSFETDDKLFAVFEPKDVEYLINRLKRCVKP